MMTVDQNGNRWYKGNLHTHTTRSDGQRTPEEAISLYQGKGYDFLALTDHWKPSLSEERKGILLLSGCEYDVGKTVQEGVYHIVGVGMEREPALRKNSHLKPQQIIDEINAVNGISILCHPAWSMNRAEDVMPLQGLTGAEIYNSVSGRPWNARPYSGSFVDDLASRGKLLPCMAADDAHFYDGDETFSYLMVNAEACTRESILSAIQRGDFYASQGPELYVHREGNKIVVDCSPVRDVVFFSDLIYAADRVTRGSNVTHAEYQIKEPDSFVRVEIFDETGRCAWSSPIAVGD